MWSLYRVLGFLFAPLWLLVLVVTQGGRARLKERIGLGKRREDAPVWIQAVSVGEVRIALRLAAALEERGLPVALSSTTATGLALAEEEGDRGRSVRAFPLDTPGCVKRALKRLNPRALVLVETEIWPALFREARRAGVPTLVVNARLSDRALKRTLAFKKLYGRILQDVQIAAQSEEHASRFQLLGAHPDRTVVLGNLKYDLVTPPSFERVREELRAYLPGGPLWVAGSVREGEEGPVVAALEALRETVPQARLILAPRHINRAPRCLEACAQASFEARLRSQGPFKEWDVLVLDTVGELWSAYSLGDAAFVGGSLVPLGGQNVLEPAFLGLPVLFGPHTENFRGECERLLAAGGAFRVETAAELGWRLAGLLSDPDLASDCGRRAREAAEKNRGAVEKTAKWIAETIPGV